MDQSMRNALLWDLPAALVLLTRLPLPRLPENAFTEPARATWAYPVVGLILGLLATGVWAVSAAFGLPPVICAILTLSGLALMTGALHEDGLADTADGLWGGHDRDRRLEIMRDSRIGSYGVLALAFLIPLRIAALTFSGPAALIPAAILSRASLPVLMASLPHARSDGLARSVGTPPMPSVASVLAIALVATLTLSTFSALLAVILVTLALAIIAKRKIGGQTGDILGAAQITGETAVLLAMIR